MKLRRGVELDFCVLLFKSVVSSMIGSYDVVREVAWQDSGNDCVGLETSGASLHKNPSGRWYDVPRAAFST